MNLKNSCGKKRGCSVTIILPNDRRFFDVSAKVLRERNDIKTLLPIFNVSLDKKLAA